MAHSRLFPRRGESFISPGEAVRRLAAEFVAVTTDRQQGAEHVWRMVTQLRRMGHLTPPPATPDEIARLEVLAPEAVFVLLSDGPASGQADLTTCIFPDHPLFFGYSSAQHQAASRPLLERCAKVLGYEIEGG